MTPRCVEAVAVPCPYALPPPPLLGPPAPPPPLNPPLPLPPPTAAHPLPSPQVKLWTIPEGGLTASIKEPLITLEGHGKPVTLLNWNPVANNVLASVGKEPSVRVWDVTKGATVFTLSGFEGLVQDFTWNSNGAEIMTSDKGKAAKIFDVRSGEKLAEWHPHGGGKPFKVVYLGDTGNIVTAGFTAQAKREFKVWSRAAGFDKPLTTIDLDQSAGALLPFYDEDTRMMYLTGKGDGNVRYYEFTDDAPYVHPLTEYRSNVSTKGADFLPKRGLRVMNCEVAHMLKLTGNSVEPIPFIVPRKETTFQEDIFPDTCVLPRKRSALATPLPHTRAANTDHPPTPLSLPPSCSYAGVPCMEADAWCSGQNVAGPKKVTLDPSKGGKVASHAGPAPARSAVSMAAGGGGSSSAAAAASSGSGASAAPSASTAALEAKLAKAEARAHDLEGQVSSLEGQVASLTAAVTAAVGSAGGSAPEGGAGDAAKDEEISALKARVAELEASEAKLKKAVAALSA